MKSIFKKYEVRSGLSPILYHWTSESNAVSILDKDQFILPTFLGSQSDFPLNKGKMFYLSTSRQKAGGYHLDRGGVVLELDGTKLSHNYGGTPFDYWGPDWRKALWEKGHTAQFLKTDENEDRLLTNKPTIPKASQYIKSIHILFKNTDHAYTIDRVRTILKLAKQKKIPVFVYDDEQYFLLQRKSKAVPISSLDLKPRKKEYTYSPRKSKNPFTRYLRIFFAKKKKDLTYKDVAMLQYDDTYRSLEADLHNSRADLGTRSYLGSFFKVWKKLGAVNAKDFMQKLTTHYNNLPE